MQARDAFLAGSQVEMDTRTLNESSSTTEGAARVLHCKGGAAATAEDHRFFRPISIGRLGPAMVWVGGPSLVMRHGDTIMTDSEKGTRDHFVDQSGLESQRKAWTSPLDSHGSGALRKYADQVWPAGSSIARAGGKAKVVCHAAD